MRANVDLHARFKVLYFSHARCKNKILFQIANVFLNLEVFAIYQDALFLCILFMPFFINFIMQTYQTLRLPVGVSPGWLPEGESVAPSENETLSVPSD